jgi:hypothetical protein
VRTLWRGVLRSSPSPLSFIENGTDPIAFTLVENEAGSPGDVVSGLIEAVGTVDTPAAYISENKAPAAQLNWVGALRLFPSLTAASVLLVVFALELNRPDIAAPHPWLP